MIMMDSLPPIHRPAVNDVSTTHRDLVDDRYRELRRPRKVHFFCNGDRYFKGKRLHITPHRYLSFHDLLGDLTAKLPKTIQLPYGVRQIYTPVGGTRVRDIEDLADGGEYVCAGFEAFKSVQYGKHQIERWSNGRANNYDHFQDFNNFTGSYPTHRTGGGYFKGMYGGFHPNRHNRNVFPRGRAGAGLGGAARTQARGDPGGNAKPRVITVVRFGDRPRTVVKILLNRNSIRSFEQLMIDISESFGPKWKNKKIKKLFSAKGKPIQSVSDFFREDDIYVAVGEDDVGISDVQDILDELGTDRDYTKKCLREWQKRKKQNKGFDDDKRDSGFADGEQSQGEAEHKNESSMDRKERKSRAAASTDPRDGRRTRNTYHDKENRRSAEQTSSQVAPSSSDPYEREKINKSRLENEKRRAGADDRDRARRLMQKRLEAEQRALDDEKRRRGLIPLRPYQDPYKKMLEDREKQRANRRRRRGSQVRQSGASESESEPTERKNRGQDQRIGAGDTGLETGRKSQRKNNEQSSNVDEIDKVKEMNSGQGDNSEVEAAAVARKEEERKENERREMEDREKAKQKRAKEKEDREKEERAKAKEEQEKANEQKRKQDEEVQRFESDNNKEKTPKSKEEVKNVKKNSSDNHHGKRPAAKMTPAQRKMERQISNVNHVYDRYEIGKTLGDGNFAVVKQCKLKNTNNEYAMKIVDKAKLKGKEHMIESEIAVMKMCNHPNICKLKEEYETRSEIFLVMELVKGGDLFDAITGSVKFSEKKAASMVTDLTNALFYLHSRNIVHRDMKPENLLVCHNKDESMTLKLGDFGLAMEVDKPIMTVCGTPTYVAPEILSEIGYGLEVDMWALGVITYILLCGFPPFRSQERKQTELFEFIKEGVYEFLSPYWDNISRSAKDLIENLLVVEKKGRYTAIDVLCHPWIITQANTLHPPESMASYRINLRKELEIQGKLNLDSHRKAFHGTK
ncbi:serine/threonine-protein kinase DCLK3-like isoform X2 [Tubulanus polymorphus]|uniref:serine/threonine-protein kinase DCLK3-like isoform X2 n=1 Tax=Tubulanus polymorphus TaxID=672921 RepID=UPI003DA3971D